MLKERNKIGAPKIVLFSVLIVTTAVVTTIVYWAVFGFDRWKTDMKTASNLLTAAATTPCFQGYTSQSGVGQYLCPTHGGIGLPMNNASGILSCPLCGQQMQFNSPIPKNNNLTVAARGTL